MPSRNWYSNGDENHYQSDGGWYGRRRWVTAKKGTPPIYLSESLAPLVRQLRKYDDARVELETKGGTLASLKHITDCLQEVVAVNGRMRGMPARLVDQNTMRLMLLDVSAGRVHLQVRRLESGMPVYYLCRTRLDYWSEYRVVVEDLYRSPGYPMDDERFVSLMTAGHETYHLRLSPYRAGAGALVADGTNAPSEWQVDSMLHRVARNVFQAAWHEDQRAAILVASALDLPELRRAVELLYLCLSAELCELRGAADGAMLAFFEDVYPQPAIRDLLLRLDGLDGAAMTELPRTALIAYSQLLNAFGRFLRTEVEWAGAGDVGGAGAARTRPAAGAGAASAAGKSPGPGVGAGKGARAAGLRARAGAAAGKRSGAGTAVPLYKLVFANFGRLEGVAGKLSGDPAVAEQRERLEKVAREMVGEIVGGG